MGQGIGCETMLKSVELKKDLESLRNKMQQLQAAGQIEEAHGMIEEAKSLQNQIAAAEQEEGESFQREYKPLNKQDKEPETMEEIKEMNENKFFNAVRPNEKISDKFQDQEPAAAKDVDFGRMVKAFLTGNFQDAANEQKYLNATMQTGTNTVLIPSHLSNTIFDLARSKSAIFGRANVTPLKNGNLTIARLKEDVKATFVKESEAIPSSVAAFDGVTLRTKYVGVIIPLSMELLHNAENVTEALYTSIAGAVAAEVDRCMVYGNGAAAVQYTDVLAGKTGGSEELKGITTYAGINKVAVTGSAFEYDHMTAAIKPIKKANITPKNIVMNTDEELEMLSAKDTTGRYLGAPKAVENITIDSSNNIKEAEALAVSSDSIIVGVGSNIVIEKGYVNDQVAKRELSIRAYLPIDIAVLDEKAISHVTRAAARTLKK